MKAKQLAAEQLTAGNDITSGYNDTTSVQQDGTESTRKRGRNSSVGKSKRL
jgi:hypothetical protein